MTKVLIHFDLAEKDEYHNLTFSLTNDLDSINFSVRLHVVEPTIATIAYYQHELLKMKYMNTKRIVFTAYNSSGFRISPEKIKWQSYLIFNRL